MGHPVAPAPLGPIEPLVRPGQHGAKILSRPDQGGAQAHGHGGGIRRHGRHCGADPLRHLQQYPLVYLRQQDQKLLATAAHEEILPPQLGGDALADPAQDLVTGLVAEAIVDLLEVIEIQHDEAGEMLPLYPVVILVEEKVAVVEAGELIRLPEPLEPLLQLVLAGDAAGHPGHRPLPLI